MEKEITIYDIARHLNISPATVSRALNDHPAINSDTKSMIASTAKEMGYRMNTFASSLRKKRTNTIGVIVPRLDSNFMSTVLAGMEKVANGASYNLIISQSMESFKKEITNAKTMFDSRVDGLLVSLAYDTENLDHFAPFIKRNIPLLFFDRVMPYNQSTNVIIDNKKAGYDVTDHLIQQGCRQIMHITGSLKRNVYADRLKGYQQALQHHKIEYNESLVKIVDLGINTGQWVLQEILKMPVAPDGLFVANDFCAVSSMNALKRAGFSIPQDIAIAGFNNDPLSQIVEPNLTTIHYPGYEMGEISVKSLINHLNGISTIHSTNTIILRSELIIRDSSKRVNSN